MKTYTRSTPVKVGNWGAGAVGAMQWVFESPNGHGLEAMFRSHILDLPALLEAPRRPRLVLVRWFLQELQQRGFERRGEWPFNVERRGYVSISKFIDKVLDEHPHARFTARLCSLRLQAFGTTAGSAIGSLRECLGAYLRVYGRDDLTGPPGMVTRLVAM